MPIQQGSLPNEIVHSGARRWLWWALAALGLIIGYADLWRGGETLAPILLVVSYCILVPVAILKR